MPVINQSELVPYTAEEMFALVASFEDYPVFLPWCERSWVVSREGAVTRAGMAVRKGKIHYSFLTDNTADAPQRLDVRLAEGPFRKLVGGWTFAPNALGCRVTLSLDMSISPKSGTTSNVATHSSSPEPAGSRRGLPASCSDCSRTAESKVSRSNPFRASLRTCWP